MSKKTACVNPYVFPGLKLTQRERENFKNNQRSLRYRISKDEILEIIAEECCIKVSDIADKTRKREVINGRFIFCGIMKEHFGYSLNLVDLQFHAPSYLLLIRDYLRVVDQVRLL